MTTAHSAPTHTLSSLAHNHLHTTTSTQPPPHNHLHTTTSTQPSPHNNTLLSFSPLHTKVLPPFQISSTPSLTSILAQNSPPLQSKPHIPFSSNFTSTLVQTSPPLQSKQQHHLVQQSRDKLIGFERRKHMKLILLGCAARCIKKSEVTCVFMGPFHSVFLPMFILGILYDISFMSNTF